MTLSFTKLFSNWLHGSKTPKRLDVAPSGNKFNENFCSNSHVQIDNHNHNVKRKLEGMYTFLQLYFSFNYGISFVDHRQHQEPINFTSSRCSSQPKKTVLFTAIIKKNITLGRCLHILQKQKYDTKRNS